MTQKIKHIGIILDGNRRFARSLNLSPWKGHEYGEKKVFALLNWCKEFKIKEVTVYAFSVQNLNRPKKEFNYLMKLFLKVTDKALEDDEFLKSDIKINILGDLSVFPIDVQEKMLKLIDFTKNNKSYIFNIAFGYGGREEILRAVKNIAVQVDNKKLKPEDINEEVFSKHLYLNSEPDFIIRTGGDCRTSNFLPWQSTYSEWFFLEKKWPEFDKKDLKSCIDKFLKRERRFGK